MAAGTPSFVTGTRTEEAYVASVPLSLSCLHHIINPHTELPNHPLLLHMHGQKP